MIFFIEKDAFFEESVKFCVENMYFSDFLASDTPEAALSTVQRAMRLTVGAALSTVKRTMRLTVGAEFFEVHGCTSHFLSRDEKCEVYPVRQNFFDVPR